MKKRQNNSTRATALQITLSVALMAVSAILFAYSFRAAPQATSDGFYPPLPQSTELKGSFYPPLNTPEGIFPLPGVTVFLPTTTIDCSVPTTMVNVIPVTVTQMDSTTTGGVDMVGFQGDFTYDPTVIGFGTPQVTRDGLTVSPSANWNLTASIFPNTPS